MAINVNTVYRTVLLILNKEERGYVTPDEFNKISTQVQLEIFGDYSNSLNQQLRVPQSDTDYADRVASIDEHLSIFKTFGTSTYVPVAGTIPAYFSLPTTDSYGDEVELYTLGTVIYNDTTELQRLQRMDFYNIQKSPLTKSTTSFPTYLLENDKLFIKPDTITSNISVNFLRKPKDPRWGYTIGAVGQYIYDTNVYEATGVNVGLGTLNDSITAEAENIRLGTYSGVAYTQLNPVGSGLGFTIIVSGTEGNEVISDISVTSGGKNYEAGDTFTVSNGAISYFPSGPNPPPESTGPTITLRTQDLNSGSTYGSTNIELDIAEQTSFIMKVLFYFGVVIKDPQIIQVAASQIQREEMNEKS